MNHDMNVMANVFEEKDWVFDVDFSQVTFDGASLSEEAQG